MKTDMERQNNMAKYRVTPCVNYVCAGLCKKGRAASYSGYCQHCSLYEPRCKEKTVNKKKQKLEKIRKREDGKENV